MATPAERMDSVEDRLDRIERLTEHHGAFVTRFEEKVDRYIYALAMGDGAMQVLNLDAVRRRTAAGRPSR